MDSRGNSKVSCATVHPSSLSAGEAHDITAYGGLMEQRDSDPGVMLADKDYDSNAISQDLR